MNKAQFIKNHLDKQNAIKLDGGFIAYAEKYCHPQLYILTNGKNRGQFSDFNQFKAAVEYVGGGRKSKLLQDSFKRQADFLFCVDNGQYKLADCDCYYKNLRESAADSISRKLGHYSTDHQPQEFNTVQKNIDYCSRVIDECESVKISFTDATNTKRFYLSITHFSSLLNIDYSSRQHFNINKLDEFILNLDHAETYKNKAKRILNKLKKDAAKENKEAAKAELKQLQKAIKLELLNIK